MAKKVIYVPRGFDTNDLKVFEERVSKAKDAGFTHVDISMLEDRSRWAIDDPEDPWLHWNLINASFFKRIVPNELKNFVPADTVKKNMDLIVGKGKILEKYGMNGVYTSWDPTWLPESFFEIHPDWRGPRIDHPRRSVHKRFAPCMDHPGVLNLYRETVKKLIEKVPCIDTITLYSNDSGSGMCWSEYLYNNANGPMACRHISVGKRVATFLDEIRKGALDAGVDAEVTMGAQFSDTEVSAILGELKPGTGLLDWNNTVKGDLERFSKGGSEPVWVPVSKMPSHFQVANSIRAISGAGKIIFTIKDTSKVMFDEYMEIVKGTFAKKKFSIVDRNKVLLKIAEKSVGKKYSADLFEAWELLEKGTSLFTAPRVGGNIFEIASLMERWITRPLVAFPLELSEEETSYYRKHQFQANGDEVAADMFNCQAAYFLDSEGSARFLDTLWEIAIMYLEKAAVILQKIADSIDDKSMKEELIGNIYSIKITNCFAINAINVAFFQAYMDDYTEPEEGVLEIFIDKGNRVREYVYNIYRSEIDNTMKLIELIKEASKGNLLVGEREDQEDIFTFSPKIADQLQKKIDIMMYHWQDLDRIFPRPNR